MDWSGIADSLMPLIIPLLLTGGAWFVQGHVLENPKEQKAMGKALKKVSIWLFGAAIFVIILVEVFDLLGRLLQS